LSDLAFHLTSSGRSVHVVISRQLYDDPRAELLREEIVRGIHTHRLATAPFGRSALPGRNMITCRFVARCGASSLGWPIAGSPIPLAFRCSPCALPSDAAPTWSIGCRTSARRPLPLRAPWPRLEPPARSVIGGGRCQRVVGERMAERCGVPISG